MDLLTMLLPVTSNDHHGCIFAALNDILGIFVKT